MVNSISSYIAKELIDSAELPKERSINKSFKIRLAATLSLVVSAIEVLVAAIFRALSVTIFCFLPKSVGKKVKTWNEDANKGIGVLWSIAIGDFKYSLKDKAMEFTDSLKKKPMEFMDGVVDL